MAGPTGLGLILVVAGITWFGHLGRAFVRPADRVVHPRHSWRCWAARSAPPRSPPAQSPPAPITRSGRFRWHSPSRWPWPPGWRRRPWATPVRAGHPMADPGHRRQPDHRPGGGRDPPADRGAARELHPYRRTRPGRRTATTRRRVPTAGREPHPRRPTGQPRRITDHRREPVLGGGKAGRPAASPQGSPPPGPTCMETLRNPDDHPGNGAVRRWTSARLANPLDRGAAFSSRWARCSECSAPPDTQLANDSTGTDQPSRRDRTASEPTRPVQLALITPHPFRACAPSRDRVCECLPGRSLYPSASDCLFRTARQSSCGVSPEAMLRVRSGDADGSTPGVAIRFATILLVATSVMAQAVVGGACGLGAPVTLGVSRRTATWPGGSSHGSGVASCAAW